MSFGGTPVPQDLESLLEETTYSSSSSTSRLNVRKICIIVLVALLFMILISVVSTLVKMKYSTLSNVSNGRSATNFTLSIISTTASTNSSGGISTISTDASSKPTDSQLLLVPKYNTTKSIVVGSEVSGSNDDELKQPITLALDSKSNLFVADAGNFRVVKYVPNSKKGQIILGHGSDRFPKVSIIKGLVIDKNDLLYTYQYNESLYGQVIIWPSSSQNGTEIFTNYGYIASFTIDLDLNIYVAWNSNVEIYLAPTYEDKISKRVFGKPDIQGTLPISVSSIYIDTNSNIFALDMKNHRIQKTPKDNDYSETIREGTPTLVAITGDSHNNLYAIDSNSSLIIYNSTGDVISTMYNAIDNPYLSESWSHAYKERKETYIPDNFATLVLDANNGDLYILMYGYDRVTKFTLET